MRILVSFLNNVAVSIFGSVLAASFCNALHTRKNKKVFWIAIVVFLLLQGGIYSFRDAEFLRRIYPVVVHVPLTFVLCILTGRRLWPVISVLTAYLCCQLRRWLALFVVALVSGDAMTQNIVELAVTAPILLLLLRFVAPAVRQFSDRPGKFQVQFGVIPALYYVFDYLTVVYTNVLTGGSPVVVEFMPLVCCAGYLVFLLYYAEEEQKRIRLQQIRNSLDIQLKQSVREISALRESQELAKRYRHDLRHHLQFISAYMENGREEQAQEYIREICQEIEAQKVVCYCENEAVNLILSSFSGRALREGIGMQINGALPETLPVSERDLCVLLSNALENAVHACQAVIRTGREAQISVRFYEQDGRFFLQTVNPYCGELRFERGLPVSDRAEHGIGVQSICAIVERYGGVYSFLAKDGEFILRLSL